MPFAFLIIGLMLIVIGVRGQTSEAGQLAASEFTGSNSFVQWFLAIMILGTIGYYKPVRPLADGMLGLVIVTMFLAKANPNSANGGFFSAFEKAVQNATPSPAATNTSTLNVGDPNNPASLPNVGSGASATTYVPPAGAYSLPNGQPFPSFNFSQDQAGTFQPYPFLSLAPITIGQNNF
jgi:hypothetical protein